MARTLNDEEERNRRIELVGSYIIKTGSSIRDTVEYFNENFFKISIPTVVDYRNLYLKRHPQFKVEMQKIINQNSPETIESEEVKNRVLKIAKLITSGFTISEIQNKFNASYWTIYRDIERLKKLDEALYNEVKKIINQRVEENIRKK